MIRLPATGISISQVDLNQHFNQLDIYQGLLRQGFKKNQIIRYLEQQRSDEQQQQQQQQQRQVSSPLSAVGSAPSTLDLHAQTQAAIENDSSMISEAIASSAREIMANSRQIDEPEIHKHNGDPKLSESKNTQSRGDCAEMAQHAPRQSSLLRFGEVPSSDNSLEGHTANTSTISPRTIRYRPRSLTYSYDQSVPDEDDGFRSINNSEGTVIERFEHIAIDDEIVEERQSTRPATLISFSLSAEAEPFVPASPRLIRVDKGKRRASTPSSSRESSSSPVLRIIRRVSTPELPPFHRSSPVRTPPRTLSQQYFDSQLRVYNDFRPAHTQPQTPAEIDRIAEFNEWNTAYTAPPGMLRTSARHDEEHPFVHDHSPVQRAHLVRLRRQREVQRSTRIDGFIRYRRGTDGIETSSNGLDGTREEGSLRDRAERLWRGELGSDDTGAENEDVSTTTRFGRIRAVSGNTRAL